MPISLQDNSPEPAGLRILRSQTWVVKKSLSYRIDLQVVARPGRAGPDFGINPQVNSVQQTAARPATNRDAPTMPAARPTATSQKPTAPRPSNTASRRKDTPVVEPATKTAQVLALLRRPAGVSLKELRKATGWQAHSVRGFLSGTLKKKLGLRVDAVGRGDDRVYRLPAK